MRKKTLNLARLGIVQQDWRDRCLSLKSTMGVSYACIIKKTQGFEKIENCEQKDEIQSFEEVFVANASEPGFTAFDKQMHHAR